MIARLVVVPASPESGLAESENGLPRVSVAAPVTGRDPPLATAEKLMFPPSAPFPTTTPNVALVPPAGTDTDCGVTETPLGAATDATVIAPLLPVRVMVTVAVNVPPKKPLIVLPEIEKPAVRVKLTVNV